MCWSVCFEVLRLYTKCSRKWHTQDFFKGGGGLRLHAGRDAAPVLEESLSGGGGGETPIMSFLLPQISPQNIPYIRGRGIFVHHQSL